jgi:hypothetical protein
VLVNGLHGAGIAATVKADKSITYTGKALSVNVIAEPLSKN